MKKKKKSGKGKKIGLPPGSIIFTGERKVDEALIHQLQFDSTTISENIYSNEHINFKKPTETGVNWYDIRGLHDTKLIENIGKYFDIHSLILEDVANTHHRPKYEEYLNGIFVVIRALYFDQESNIMLTEQVAIFFRKGLLISFQETESDLFESIRNRLQIDNSRIRQNGSDYLCYALIDCIVDHYYEVLEDVQEVIENLEDKLVERSDTNLKTAIHKLRKELLQMKKSIAPLREAISKFSKSEDELIDTKTNLFTRDLYDHIVQIMDSVENQRDLLNGLQDLYLSEMSFKMNQVMQVLTIITTIFVPMSFLAGLYGMNFDNIPELHHPYGYFILLAVMGLIFAGSLTFFKKRGWF